MKQIGKNRITEKLVVNSYEFIKIMIRIIYQAKQWKSLLILFSILPKVILLEDRHYVIIIILTILPNTTK